MRHPRRCHFCENRRGLDLTTAMVHDEELRYHVVTRCRDRAACLRRERALDRAPVLVG